MVTIQNVSRRMQVFQLDHGSFQDKDSEHGYRLHHAVVVDHAKNGMLSMRRVPRHLPSALRLAAGEIRDGLPDAVLHCAQVAAAIERREVRVLRQTTEDAATPPPKTQREGFVSRDRALPRPHDEIHNETKPGLVALDPGTLPPSQEKA